VRVKSALAYLLTARRSEIDELERLAATSQLVGTLARFIHALQRERGISNIYLASRGQRFGDMRAAQVPECEALRDEVLHGFEALAQDPGARRNAARLFNRIAVTVEALDGLPSLRERIAAVHLPAPEATAAYVRLIAGLLAVVFEAADSAGDPDISRALVAMFHFMQGKEYAGQERAHGAAVFAGGRIDAAAQQQWRHLIQQQHHCLEVFKDFAEPSIAAQDLAGVDHRTLVQLERLRRTGQEPGTSAGGENLVDAWYECCTVRLDAMRAVEDLLAAHLRSLCERQIEAAHESMRNQQATLDRLHHEAASPAGAAPRVIGPQLERSVLDMVHEQSLRLQEMSDELETARAALTERKVIERAKGLLMAHRQLTEDEAWRSLRQMAMNQKRRIVDVAEAVLAMAAVLPGR
jgi:hypothetical protein